MPLKLIFTAPVFLVLATAAGATEPPRSPQRYADVPPSSGAGPAGPGGLAAAENTSAIGLLLPAIQASREVDQPRRNQGKGEIDSFSTDAAQTNDQPGAKKVKAPSGGTKLPAVQKVREAANRTPQADKHRGEIEIQSWSAGAVGGAAEQGTRHSGGVNVLMGDGSVRNSVSPVGGNETISIGANSTETKPGSGSDSVWMDLGSPVGRAPGSAPGNAPKGGSLGSLQGMGSIGQLSAPQGAGDAAGGQVRNRMFSIVDRTPMAKDGANTGAVGGNKTETIGIGRSQTTAGGGPNVRVFSGNDGAGAARPSSNIAIKGQAIKQN